MDPVKSALRLGEVVELSIEKGVYRGLGLARHHGQVVFVPHVLPGERVRARVQETGRGFVQAHLLEILTAGAERRVPPCPYVPACGGCAHQEIEYPGQLRLKESVLREALTRAGVVWDAPIAVRPSPEQSWRTRATFHFGTGASGLRLGLYEEGTHRVVDVENCLQVSPAMNRAARALLEALRSRPAEAAVQGVELAESGAGDALAAALLVGGELEPARALQSLAGDIPGLTGLGIAAERHGRSSYIALAGEPYVTTTVAGLRFRAHVQSFFQGNRFLVEPLAQAVLAALPLGAPVLDLYSGVGLFSLLAARRGERVRSAELGALAVADARFNAETAGIGNVEIAATDVRPVLRAWPAAAGESIVLDPPRSGVESGIVEALAARGAATIVYVSCDPPTLGRDLARLLKSGYRLESLEAFDLFPDTFHVESLAVLRRS